MNKIIYWIGIYAICATVHDAINYVSEPIDILLHKKFKEKMGKETKPKNKSVNLSKGTVGDTIDRIGF